MDLNLEDFKSPGQLLRYLLNANGWSQRILALILGIGESALNKMVQDRQPVTAEVAIQLSEVFGVEADAFLELQKKYDLAHARLLARPDPARESRAHLLGRLPVSEMIKRSWINVDDIRNLPQVESELTRFFGAESVNEIEILPHAARKTNVAGEATPTQMAWLYRVKQIASGMLVAKYSAAAVRRALVDLAALRSAPELTRKVPRILTECGVRFVIVEGLKSARIDGACFWLNAKAPVVGMTLRYDRIDNFWFVLRHELEHVLRLHGQSEIALDVELEGEAAGTGPTVAEEERLANAAAAEFCVPQDKMRMFARRKAPYFAERDIQAFGRMIGVHPGLIVGQLHHLTARHNLFRHHLAGVRAHISSSAIADGWGDVVPIHS